MKGEERKPAMDKDKRKVLNLLEFLSALTKMRVCQLIVNAIPPADLERRGNDVFYYTDAEMAGYLQSYADEVSQYLRHHDESGGHNVDNKGM
jgi:hypothetical protein